MVVEDQVVTEGQIPQDLGAEIHHDRVVQGVEVQVDHFQDH